jgi:hypothetical protein
MGLKVMRQDASGIASERIECVKNTQSKRAIIWANERENMHE